MQLIMYSKPGCHLCEGLAEKLQQIRPNLNFDLEIRDITTRPDWFDVYQCEIPVLCRMSAGKEQLLPRPSPRASTMQLQQMLQKYLSSDGQSAQLDEV
jgi:Glutaredoxin-like domain (DUF836)